MYQLYNYFRSSASFRVRIALQLKQLPFETIPVHLLNQGGEQFFPEYQKINPSCLVPALKEDNKIISQSLAIIEYLDEMHPEPALLPNDAYQKALVRSFALAIIADTHPLNNLRVLQYLTKTLSISDEEKNKWYQHWIAITFQALEQQLMHADTYCFGNTPTLADICLVPQMYNARRFHCDLTPYPTLVRMDAACQAHPAFQQAWPNEPTA